MMIHIWMHWFWITTVYFKGFLFLTGPTISVSCISPPHIAEAGLLENETVVPVTPSPFPGTNSSQLNVTSPDPPDTSPQEETSTEETTTPKPEDGARSTGDVEDIYTGGTLDVFQYPLKKFTKYSHLKYGKVKPKGKPNEETEDRKVESVKMVEEKVNINISITEEGRGEVETSEAPTSDAPDLITTTIGNVTEEGGNETLSSSTMSTTKASEVLPTPTETQKEVEMLKNETLVIENKVEESVAYTTVEPFVVKNRVAAATSAQNYEPGQTDLNAGSITGITLGILVIFSLFGAVSFVLYRRRYLNKPQVLHDKCSNLDSSGYIDETSLRENSEEMYSLDNDSFLNSLEAMTIQNYWTENVKHTKL